MIVQKQTSGLGGFKMPAEIARGKKYYQQNINNDLPTKDELFSQLGIMPDDDSVKVNNHKDDHLRISKQLIQEKLKRLYYINIVRVIKLLGTKTSNSISDQIEKLEKMLEEHKQQMHPIAEQYEQMRLSDVRSKSYNPKRQRSQSPKVRVTYHEEPINTYALSDHRRILMAHMVIFQKQCYLNKNYKNTNLNLN